VPSTSSPGRSRRAGRAGLAVRLLADPWLRLGLLVVLAGAVTAWSLQGDGWSADGVRAQVEGLGAAGPPVYVLLYAAATTILVPAAPFTVAAGLLFGPVTGTGIALTGATLGAAGAFLLGRALGRDAARRLGGRHAVRLDRFLHDRGFVAVLILRLVPLFPYNVINVSAGVTGIRMRDYVTATAIGIVPGTVVYVALGGSVTDPTSPAFLGAVAAFGLLTLGAGFAARRMRRRETALEIDPADAGR
jgi:uncharacterized membrane protein YdjX (TVP38/TMEM64 family)